MGRLVRRRRNAEVPSAPGAWQVPKRFNFTVDVVETLAADRARTAMIFVDREGVIERRTFLQMASDANRWAALLHTAGLAQGDRVLVHVGRTPAYHAVVLGALKAGLVVVPCPTDLTAAGLDVRAAHSRARLLITDPQHLAEASKMAAAVDVLTTEETRAGHSAAPGFQAPDTTSGDPAFIFYSETGGEPIGVVHSHAYTWALRLSAEYWLDAQPGDIVWCTAEMGSARALRDNLFGPWSRGAEVVVHEHELEPEEHAELVRRLGVTILSQSPGEYRLLATLPEPSRFSGHRVRHAISDGNGLDLDLAPALRDTWGITIFEGYGRPETGPIVANMPQNGVRSGSIGFALPGFNVSVFDEDGNEQPDGVEGELAVRRSLPSLFSGYWNAPEATRAVFRGDWYPTGDRATRDDDGYLWLADGGRRTDAVGTVAVAEMLPQQTSPVRVEAGSRVAPEPERQPDAAELPEPDDPKKLLPPAPIAQAPPPREAAPKPGAVTEGGGRYPSPGIAAAATTEGEVKPERDPQPGTDLVSRLGAYGRSRPSSDLDGDTRPAGDRSAEKPD